MDCPICGEELPLNAKECPVCGEPIDRFFLTEEVQSSRVRKRAIEPERKQEVALPMARASRRGINWKLWGTVGGAAVFVVGMAILFAFVVFGGGGAEQATPQEIVEGYYESLSRGDVEDMLSEFANAYQPTSGQKSAIQSAVGMNNYEVANLMLREEENDGNQARVVIEELKVKTIADGGEERELDLVSDVLEPAHEADPNARVVVHLDKEGSGWKIVDRPLGGWEPEDIWIIGSMEK